MREIAALFRHLLRQINRRRAMAWLSKVVIEGELLYATSRSAWHAILSRNSNVRQSLRTEITANIMKAPDIERNLANSGAFERASYWRRLSFIGA